jgi:two-component system, OmpR family, response regulator ChvI
METLSADRGARHLGGPNRSDQCHAPTVSAIQVIFVEDDDFYRQAVEGELVEAGFVVHAFKDGEPMFAAVAAGLTADVVVLDWGLESSLGIDLLSQMRERGWQSPVVFLTGRNSPVHERLALQRGAADFVDKSRGTSILAARLQLAVSQRRTFCSVASEEIFHCGRLTLRARTSRAYWDKADVGLTMAEFKIVHLLASNVGSFITYRQIYDCMHHVGFLAGSGEHGYRTNVRSAIRRIREKFKAQCPDFNEIQTYTSFGYRWGKP